MTENGDSIDWPDHCVIHLTRDENCAWCTMEQPEVEGIPYMDVQHHYENLLVFVSEKFRVTYGKGENNTSTLWCKEHYEVKEWDYRITDETEMMREIGKHLDTVDHVEVPCWLGSTADKDGRTTKFHVKKKDGSDGQK